MDGEFFKVTDTHLGTNGVGLVELEGGARRQHAMFYNRPVHDPIASNEAGSPVFKNVVYVQVAPPGERLNVVDRPATGQDARIWPIQWAQFQQNQQQVPEGTPISLLYPANPAITKTLQASGVHTIEQCSELSGNAIDNIGMGAQKWVNDAQRYLEMANKGVGAAKFRQELEERDRHIKVLTQQVESLSSQVKQLQSTSNTAANLEQIQQLIAGAMARPTFGTNQPLGPQFDAATAQINATHPTAQVKPRRQRIKP